MNIHYAILFGGLLLLPVFYFVLNKLADAWEAGVGKIIHRTYWPRKFILPFLVFAGFVHIALWLIIPIVRSL